MQSEDYIQVTYLLPCGQANQISYRALQISRAAPVLCAFPCSYITIVKVVGKLTKVHLRWGVHVPPEYLELHDGWTDAHSSTRPPSSTTMATNYGVSKLHSKLSSARPLCALYPASGERISSVRHAGDGVGESITSPVEWFVTSVTWLHYNFHYWTHVRDCSSELLS